MISKSKVISLYKILKLFFMQKIMFIPRLFLDVFQNYCTLLILCTLGISDPPKTIVPICGKLWCLSANKKSTWSLNLFKRFSNLNDSEVWLVKNILTNCFRTRILPHIEFAMKSQELKEFWFCIAFRRIKEKKFQKYVKYLFLVSFLLKFEWKWIFDEIRAATF